MPSTEIAPDPPPLPDRLSAADSLMWRIECDPVLRAPILVVGLLDRSPTPGGVAATIERAAAVLPRLRQRLQPPPLDLGRPRWVEDGPPALDHHLRRVAAAGGGIEAVLAMAEPDAVAAFDPARPPWTLTVVDGLDDARSALVLRFHHTITDGVGGIEIADLIFDRSRRPRRAGAAPAGAAPPRATSPAPAGSLDPRRLAVAGAEAAGRIVAAMARPTRTIASSLRLGRSAVRLLAPARRGSPALAGRSLDRRLAVTERPLAALREAGAAVGGTVNDVLLAAVGGALAAYHRALGQPVPAVRVTMPISIRAPGDQLGGNRFVPARFTLPVDDPDPAVRARIAGNLTRSWRAEPALGSTELLAAGLNLLPRPAAARLFGGMLRSIDVDAVDVPGLERPAYLGGARIDRLWAFAPPAGAALSITLVSHAGTAGIGLAADRAAVADPALLAACLEAALDEMVALGAGRAPGRSATGRSGTGRSATGRSGTGRSATGRSGTGRSATGRPRGRSRPAAPGDRPAGRRS